MKKLFFVWFAILPLLINIPVLAQEQPVDAYLDEYPTIAALETTIVPAADVVELARRFRGVDEVPPPPTDVPVRTVGEQQTFWVINTDENREIPVEATLRVVGAHIYIWVESDISVTEAVLQSLASAFDTQIYPNVRDLWGTEDSPGIDGDKRLYGLFASGLGGGVAAYFSSRNTYPQVVWPTSNEHEMFLFNLDTLGTHNLAREDIQGVVAHEFQHMIRDHIEVNEDIWLNEGFSTFTQLLLYGDAGSIPSFLNAPYTQLNDWPPDADTAPHYGAAALFVSYFYERFGKTALQQLSAYSGRGLDAFDNVLKAAGEAGVDSFFADWVLANYLQDPAWGDERYGYKLLPSTYDGARPVIEEASGFRYSGKLNQYATDYHVVTGVEGQESITVGVDISQDAALVPYDAPSGQWMWYSNRGDMSDMTLTRAFDLTGVGMATLQYKVWYDTEAYYDYGYVTVSTDGGDHWTIIQAPGSDIRDPVNSAYGPGYTGVSDGWQDEEVSLEAYAGQPVLIRFEFISDEGTTSRGMAVDTVRIPEIGYSSDFEDGPDGWQALGWVRTDNRLPQQMWVQAVQEVGPEIVIHRWLSPRESEWTVPIEKGAGQVVIALSPFAPVTNIPATYTLSVSSP